jgi:hypothetical protein
MRRGAACAVVIAFIAGCGEKGISKQEFVSRANSVCKRSDARLNALAHKLLPGKRRPNMNRFQLFLVQSYPVAQQAAAAFAAIPAPSGDKAEVRRLRDAAAAGAQAMQRAATDLRAAKAMLAGGSNPYALFNELATRYGLKDCAGKEE